MKIFPHLRIRLTDNRGLTLVELLISILILALLLTGFFYIFINSMNYSAMNGNKLKAVHVAKKAAVAVEESSLEQFIQRGIPVSDLTDDDYVIVGSEEAKQILQINEPDFDIRLRISPGPDESLPLLEVVITVTWKKETGPGTSAMSFAYLTEKSD